MRPRRTCCEQEWVDCRASLVVRDRHLSSRGEAAEERRDQRETRGERRGRSQEYSQHCSRVPYTALWYTVYGWRSMAVAAERRERDREGERERGRDNDKRETVRERDRETVRGRQ